MRETTLSPVAARMRNTRPIVTEACDKLQHALASPSVFICAVHGCMPECARCWRTRVMSFIIHAANSARACARLVARISTAAEQPSEKRNENATLKRRQCAAARSASHASVQSAASGRERKRVETKGCRCDIYHAESWCTGRRRQRRRQQGGKDVHCCCWCCCDTRMQSDAHKHAEAEHYVLDGAVRGAWINLVCAGERACVRLLLRSGVGGGVSVATNV